MTAGEQLRRFREDLGLTVREVEAASCELAGKYHNPDFVLSISSISHIENRGLTPSIFRMYSFSVIYRQPFTYLVSLYGIDLQESATDFAVAHPPRSHCIQLPVEQLKKVPLSLDPGFDPRKTSHIIRFVEEWGPMPMTFLSHLPVSDHTYGYIGTDDLLMFPLILPGSFVQIDMRKTKVEEGEWRSEFERPIYFIESRSGYFCSWCLIRGDNIHVQPHPLSPAAPMTLKRERDADVLGQVVGIAMRLDRRREQLPKRGAQA